MGIYANVTAEIYCETKEKINKTFQILKQLQEESDENGNFEFEALSKKDKCIKITHNSNRIQNLEWQMEQI